MDVEVLLHRLEGHLLLSVLLLNLPMVTRQLKRCELKLGLVGVGVEPSELEQAPDLEPA